MGSSFVLYSLAVVVATLGAEAHAQALPCGELLSTYRGVPVGSNGEFQGQEQSCTGRGPFGLQYQCLEYVRRFYSEALGVDTTQW